MNQERLTVGMRAECKIWELSQRMGREEHVLFGVEDPDESGGSWGFVSIRT